MPAWTEDEQKILEEMAKEFSASQIGKRLGRKRHSVIGRAWRTGVSLSKSSDAITRLIKHQIGAKPRPYKAPPIYAEIARRYPAASFYEISEACAAPFEKVRNTLIDYHILRKCGSDADYRTDLVARMRADLLDAA